MDVLTEKERAEKENQELVEKLNAENARLTEELSSAQKEESKREAEGKFQGSKSTMLFVIMWSGLL